ncbi:terminase gpA endonuclease subunit [Citrobacter amalonaticus]|nr:terminase gpA endonuclease subunit [Citrobacter sp. RHB35-C17]QMD61812.1 phage terminase large subunit family protein [Citrobacter sp. RHB35-C17]
MNISNSQVKGLQHSARAGLHSLYRPEPQTAVEWADTHYYLPKESAYQEGRWETLPFQRAIMNAMGNDYIREVNVVKSARVGYSKMLLGVYAYFIEHKQRNSLIWLPTDGDAENFMKSHVEPTTGKRKTFVNTTLGETWEPKIGERPDADVMAERKEHFEASVPDRVAYLTAGIDSQLDRYEMRVWGWGPGEESWLIDRQIIMGRHDDEATLLRVDEAINKTYPRQNGVEMSISRICWDIGGIDPTIVYNRSKKHGLFRVIPIKGASVYGKPVANMPRKRNKNGVYLTEVGTDTAKEQIYNRFTLVAEGDEPLPGAVHFPNNPDIYDLTEAQQLTAEEQVEKWVDGRKKIVWDSKKRRNEALDCFVYALAALRISISRWQLNLDSLLASLLEEEGARKPKKTVADYARALSGDE